MMGATNPGWKKFERDMAKLIDGRRFFANSGETIDIEGPMHIGQCKEVASMSLNELTQLAQDIAVTGQAMRPSKYGIVCVRLKRGAGKPKATPLIVMTADTFKSL